MSSMCVGGSVSALLLFATFVGCASAHGIPARQSGTGEVACFQRLNFALDHQDHAFAEIQGLPVVRSLVGTVKSKVGSWPAEARPLVVVTPERRPAHDWSIRLVPDADGRFAGPPLPKGNYCLRASAPGWQTAIGLVRMSDDAPGTDSMDIELELGV